MKKQQIAVIGAGYVGLSLAVMLSQYHDVVVVDIDQKKIDKVNKRIPIFCDKDIEDFFKTKSLNLRASKDWAQACRQSDLVIIATPTDYNSETNQFDTEITELAIERAVTVHPEATIVVKSTVPVGFAHRIRRSYPNINLLFSPEFLSEGRALHGNLHPDRIIIGVDLDDERLIERALGFGELLKKSGASPNAPVRLMGFNEAEAVKLFSNTYLALRIGFFNELDTYAELNGLNSREIIDCLSLDSRIGDFYNNPSFGYGGYCLPKDTKQLLFEYKGQPAPLIQAAVETNERRKSHIASSVLRQARSRLQGEGRPTIGIYRLNMKAGSDNFRNSSVLDIIRLLAKEEVDILVYEPLLNPRKVDRVTLTNDLDSFKNSADLVIANRYSEELDDVAEKLYTRDLYNRD